MHREEGATERGGAVHRGAIHIEGAIHTENGSIKVERSLATFCSDLETKSHY